MFDEKIIILDLIFATDIFIMYDTIDILIISQITICILILISSCVYVLPILSIQRFRSPTNLLTANVSVTIFAWAVYWIVKSVLAEFFPDLYNAAPKLCTFQGYIQTMLLCQIAFSLCVVSVHRLCIIIYPQKLLLKTKKWVLICIGIQWTFNTIAALPMFSMSAQVKKQEYFRIIVFLSSVGVQYWHSILDQGLHIFNRCHCAYYSSRNY